MFVVHLQDAIALNRERRARYAEVGGHRARALSTALITAERAALPAAAWLDRRAQPFCAAGVPIIEDDFACMSQVSDWAAPPRFRSRMTPRALRRTRRSLHRFGLDTARRCHRRDFAGIHAVSLWLLQQLTVSEQAHDSHLAMSRHIVESVALAAANAVRHSAATDGATDKLAADFIRVQCFALPLAVPIDREAQRHHVLGLGMVVNDVPDLPAGA